MLLVNTYLPQIVEWILNNEPPAKLCAQLGLCSSRPALKPFFKLETEATVSVCSICEIVVQIAEAYILNDEVISKVEAKLDEVCNSFPAPYNGEVLIISQFFLISIHARFKFPFLIVLLVRPHRQHLPSPSRCLDQEQR